MAPLSSERLPRSDETNAAISKSMPVADSVMLRIADWDGTAGRDLRGGPHFEATPVTTEAALPERAPS